MRAYSLWLVLVGLLWIVSGVVSAAEQQALRAMPVGPGMEANTNRFGSDYKNFESLSAQQCQTECAKEAQCKAWTWVKPGVQGPNAKCWLKNAVPAKSTNTCCISGVKAAAVPGGTQQAVGSAPGAQALAKGKAPVAPPAVRLSAPIKSKNAQAQQSQQRFMNNVRQQNALAASTYNALLTEQGAEGLVQAGIIKPEVLTINKQQPKGYVFRPGTAVTIYGRGFGSGGQVRLLGGFRKAPALIVNENDWRPSVIYARLADDIRGEEDLDDVRLEIQPSGKSAITVPGARFEAARETTLLKDIPQRYVTLPGQQARYTTAQRDIPGLGSTYALESINAKSAIVSRYSGSDNWFAPGTDVYALALKPGFMIDSYEYWHGATSTNPSECMEHNGGEYFQGRYGVTIAAVNVVKVDWGVWRCHISPGLWTSNQNFNYSFYGLNIYVIGPRGLDPWK